MISESSKTLEASNFASLHPVHPRDNKVPKALNRNKTSFNVLNLLESSQRVSCRRGTWWRATASLAHKSSQAVIFPVIHQEVAVLENETHGHTLMYHEHSGIPQGTTGCMHLEVAWPAGAATTLVLTGHLCSDGHRRTHISPLTRVSSLA
ncbi:hypothetical protein E2C01_002544 [Portunus trituberculatus]|uniref:Uncharacterized protein n=1 Tax=Portunus trituberculatus TaxID=210409 RepID=A0A5B7CMI6_PORTR|nr:hypothetical protein [Portunus trituberculatus]